MDKLHGCNLSDALSGTSHHGLYLTRSARNRTWLESGPFCLLFTAVGKKYGRAARSQSEKRHR
jgi:hypothetical protein